MERFAGRPHFDCMTKHNLLRSPRAFAATAALLALSAAPAFAQEAVPVADPAPAAAPQTVTVSEPVVQAAPIVLPETVSEPVAATTAPTTSSARPAAPTRSARTSIAPRTAAVANTSAPAVPAASSPAQSLPPLIAGPDAATNVDPVAAPVAPIEAAPEAVAPDTDRGMEAVALGGALAILGAGALYAMTRRRRRVEDVLDETYEPASTPAVTPRDTVVAARPVAAAPSPAATPDKSAFAFGAPVIPAAAAAAVSKGSEWTDGPVPLGHDREAALDQMVAQEPDEANPFRSPKARRRRARLILQGREQRLHDKSSQPFDFRDYRPADKAEPARETTFA